MSDKVLFQTIGGVADPRDRAKLVKAYSVKHMSTKSHNIDL